MLGLIHTGPVVLLEVGLDQGAVVRAGCDLSTSKVCPLPRGSEVMIDGWAFTDAPVEHCSIPRLHLADQRGGPSWPLSTPDADIIVLHRPAPPLATPPAPAPRVQSSRQPFTSSPTNLQSGTPAWKTAVTILSPMGKAVEALVCRDPTPGFLRFSFPPSCMPTQAKPEARASS